MSRAIAMAFWAASLAGCVIPPLDDHWLDGSIDGSMVMADVGPVDAYRGTADAWVMIDAPSDVGMTPDAPPTDPNTQCDDVLAGAFFCESFEDVSLVRWGIQEATDGFASYSADQHAQGTGSLVGRTSAVGGFGERIAMALPSIGSGDLHVRAMVYVPSGPPLVHMSIFHIGGHRSRTLTETISGFNVYDEYAGMFIGAGGVTMNDRLVMVPRDRWFCVRFAMTVAEGTAGSVRLFVRDTGAEMLAGERLGIDTLPAAPYQSLGAGIAWSSDLQPGADVFIDEIAVGTTMLPCE